MRKRHLWVAGAILAFGAVSSVQTYKTARVYAQNATAPPAPQAQAPTQQSAAALAPSQAANQSPAPIRATTRLVQVSVVVHDKHGDPVTGLTKEDFAVLDEKKPQAIQVFSAETNQLPDHPPAPLPPDTYTNRLVEQAGVPTSVTVILLDGLNTKFEDQTQARQQVVKFLSQIQPQDRVALYTLGREVHILHDFTTDASSLLAVLAKFRGRQNTEVGASQPDQPIDLSDVPGTEEMQAFLDGAAQREANFFIQDRVRLTVDGLVAIADHVGSLPGRKNLVWVSGSFPIDVGLDKFDLSHNNEQLQFEDDVERAARALNAANLAVYPVDARGLIGMSAGSSASAVSARPRRGASQRIPAASPNQSEFATMDMLAERTGGKAFYNSNDIFGAVRRALDDSRVTYTLGYYPDGVAWDGKFHNIKVEVKRPGMEVRARKGYFAIPEKSVKPQNVNALMADVSRSQLDATAIGIRVTVEPVDAAGTHYLRTQIHIDLHELSIEQKEGHWTGTMDVGIALLDGKDEILKGTNETVHFNLDPAKYEAALKKGVVYRKDIPILPGSMVLRAILFDEPSGNIGSVGIPLTKYVASAQPAK
jgi:VWFA-related protein